ncbi:ABC transporter ATP-binding protein [Calidifontimicrobium sp. SYSU G02091]|uniref:ABC transporter ATP-binding protein n=1 Tax=Calidifontimicrobium sp. SYSU G02091 TaxID=2926421 RepID=UPI001F53886C|nr:ABC transporter ATP-binding protein [Calidifontimicrobium sp. SYSU G02091]MCI1193365.1 ABC transporter ATP-binding protein [Calidifontimicrobium sp. SYSU G02091]
MTPLRTHGLSLAYGPRRVVDGVSLDLRAGEWAALVGPNGAGKSTLLALLAGLRAPHAGRVELEGRTLADWPPRERARRVAWLAQHGEADGDLAARDVVRLGRLPHHGLFGAVTAADEAAVDAAMAETECAAFAERRLGELSGGERQRVLIARALAVNAPVLLLDEPMTHLDVPHQRALVASLAARARAGAAVAAVLHDLTLALAADRVLVMVAGRLRADGAPADAAVRAAVVDAFGGAVAIERVATAGGERWVALPVVAAR